jgi:hypothetical protein
MISTNVPQLGHGTSNTRWSLAVYGDTSSKIGVLPTTIFLFAKLSVRRSASRIGLPSAPASIASASSTIRTRAVCRRRFRGALAATIFKLPPGKRRDSSVLRSSPSVSNVSEPRKAGVASKIGSTSDTT